MLYYNIFDIALSFLLYNTNLLIFNLIRDAMVDPSVVFGIIFDNDIFEQYVGELAVGTLASIANDSSESNNNGDMIKDFKVLTHVPFFPNLCCTTQFR